MPRDLLASQVAARHITFDGRLATSRASSRSIETVFIMMRDHQTQHFKEIEAAIRQGLSEYGLMAHLPHDHAWTEDVWDNFRVGGN